MSHAYKTLSMSGDSSAEGHARLLLDPWRGLVQRADWHRDPTDPARGELAILVNSAGMSPDDVDLQIDIIARALEPAGCRRIRRSTAAMRAVREHR